MNNIDRKQNINNVSEVRSPHFDINYFAICQNENIIKDRKQRHIIGRNDEIYEILEILARSSKNCPLLVGDSGVGKTAIAEEIALRLIEGNVPKNLIDTKLYIFDLQMAKKSRLTPQMICQGLARMKDQAILFIDNFEKISGSEFGEAITYALEKGELQIICATTTANYQKCIQTNVALDNRLQKVYIDELSAEETKSILRLNKDKFEEVHNVNILEEAIDSAVELSGRYLGEERYPTKALGLLDEASASVMVEYLSTPLAVENALEKEKTIKQEIVVLSKDKSKFSEAKLLEKQNELKEVQEANKLLLKQTKQSDDIASEIKNIKKQIKTKEDEIIIAEEDGDIELQAILKYKDIPKLKEKLETLERRVNSNLYKNNVDKNQIAKIVERKTGINASKMFEEDKEKILGLKDQMAKRVFEQNEALELVNNVILRAKADIQDAGKPLGSFLFLGPTGVGKTEIAKTIAEQLFDSEDALIRFDMSEYQNESQVLRLIGSAPGYVGYEEGGQLTNAVKKKPYSVVLFDEVEKAHSKIFDILLQILDDGRLTDSKGTVVNFKNTIIILTSNLGAKNCSIKDAQERKNAYMDSIKEFFRPEFLNRLDEIVVFNKLSENAMFGIAKKFLDQLANRVRKKQAVLVYDDKVIEKIVKEGSDTDMGARPIRRYIQQNIETILAKHIIENDVEGKNIYLTVKDNEFIVR